MQNKLLFAALALGGALLVSLPSINDPALASTQAELGSARLASTSAPIRAALIRVAVAQVAAKESPAVVAAKFSRLPVDAANPITPPPPPPPSYGGYSASAAAGCPGFSSGSTSGAPGITSSQGVAGTTSADLAAFAAQYNAIRASKCLAPVSTFVYDSCMEARLFWMAEDPSLDPASAWGHLGSQRSDGVPSTGCDGNLAGGYGNSGSTVAVKWWESAPHRASLYRPGDSVAGVCIAFAMTHGGVPNEPYDFTRAAARWIHC